jgi:hypothetical protein
METQAQIFARTMRFTVCDLGHVLVDKALTQHLRWKHPRAMVALWTHWFGFGIVP